MGIRKSTPPVRRHGLLLVAATLAAQGNAHTRGFRQRDVRRMIEFSANWAYPEFEEGGIPFENTQIRRFLEWLVSEGFAKRTAKGKQPIYQLTPHGVMELALSVKTKRYHHDRDEFFYMFFILADYRKRIAAIVEQQGKKFPYALQLEFESLIDPRALLENQLFHAKRELLKLEKRIRDSQEVGAFVRRSLRQGHEPERLFEAVEERYPFTLNSAIPIGEVLPSLTVKQAIWELTEGGERRAKHLWQPAKEALELHIEQLKRLLKEESC